MSAIYDSVGTKVILEADVLGPCGAYKQIAAAPAGTDIMFFSFRAFWNTVTTDTPAADYGWDHTFAFGLSFDGVFPSRQVDPVFARFIGIGRSNTSFDLDYRADCGGSGKHFAGFDAQAFLQGANANTASYMVFPDGSDDSGAMNRRIFSYFPATPTVGAQVIQVWKLARSLSDSRKLAVTVGTNFESLSEANISNARTSLNTVWSKTENFTADDNFFPRASPAVFPRWLVMKNPDGQVGRQFVYDHGKVEYFKYSDSP